MKVWWGVIVVLVVGMCAGSGGEAQQIRRPIRAIHFVLGSSGFNSPAVELDSAKKIVQMAKQHGFNTLILQLANGVRWESSPELIRPGAWSKAEFMQFAEFVAQNGLVLIPEIKLLTHQEKLFRDLHPEIMFNWTTYDPQKDETYTRVSRLLEEIIQTLAPKAIHIGHDEVAGHKPKSVKKWLRKGEKMLPADLFLQDVVRLHDYLKQRGIETWMWGDMLVAPKEFPGMLSISLHGSAEGYGKALRDKLPRDIVIGDWHYFDGQADFPSLTAFKSEGFRVLGVSWKTTKTIQNFSRYAATNGAEGMIATTWFHVVRKEWDVIERIMRESGEAFRKDFPDAP